MDPEIYKKCPIAEAIYDVRVIPPKEFELKKLEDYHDEIRDEYPTKEVSIKYNSSLFIKKGEPAVHDGNSEINGFYFKSSNSKKIIQFKNNGFTFNRLAPYDKWSNFSGEAEKHFLRYLNILDPVNITRLGLRYVNRLEIPLPMNDFEDYIKTTPAIDANLPQSMSEMFMRIVLPESSASDANIAIITEAIDTKKPITNFIPLIFDIDVFREVRYEKGQVDEIIEIFNDFRRYKNKIFNESITEKMKSLIR